MANETVASGVSEARILQIAETVYTGQIFSDPDVYVEWREKFGAFLNTLQEITRAHDVGLKSLLTKNGRDSFPGEFFRQPKGWGETPAVDSVEAKLEKMKANLSV